MADSFPRQNARTRNFTLGAPRSFQISPDGATVLFLRSGSGSDPVTSLWALDVAGGAERLIADPASLEVSGEDDALERARRERVRETAQGIVGFATDERCTVAAFVLAGQVYLASLTDPGQPARALGAAAPAADPRPDPSGRQVAYVSAGALHVIDAQTGADTVLAAPPDDSGQVSYGLPEFIAAEEMGRERGYWWAPDGSAILAARVDETLVQRWHIADPASPVTPAAELRYPSAGTPNAQVTAVIARPGGEQTPVTWDTDAFPYLVTACWDGTAGEPRPPLLVVQSRDQRELRLLAVDPATGQCRVLRADTDPVWTDIVPGVPAWTASGQIAWTIDAEDTRRLLVGTPEQHAAGTAEPATPPGLQVREVLDVDGDTVLVRGSQRDPASIGLWLAGPDGLTALRDGDGLHSARRAGGTTVIASRSLAAGGATVTVTGAGRAEVSIASYADRPSLPAPAPALLSGGERKLRTAVLLPSWYQPGSGPLPVLCDPYGGPHAQRVLAHQGAFLTSQWFAEQGFAVVVADGRGTPGRGPAWDRAVAGDLATPALEDQVAALAAAAGQCADLDTSRVAIRGWSFGGYLSALAVLRRPDVFHAAIAGAPVTDWRLYDSHYTERYLGQPQENPDGYEASSLLSDAAGLRRPLMIIHGLADDNVVVAHSLRLSSALLAAGRPHQVLPLTGVTHMATQEEVAENLLLLQVEFLRTALGAAALAQSGDSRAQQG
jgi:dipeptidyl-peptidase-4